MSLILFLVLIAAAAPAQAYIDPNLGSMLLQGLLASVAAVGVAGKLYWHRLQAFFSKRSESDEGTDAAGPDKPGADEDSSAEPPARDG